VPLVARALVDFLSAEGWFVVSACPKAITGRKRHEVNARHPRTLGHAETAFE
jgi:hypothetical protein